MFAFKDGEAEVEGLIKQADDLKAEKQRLLSETIHTQRQVRPCIHSIPGRFPKYMKFSTRDDAECMPDPIKSMSAIRITSLLLLR